MTGFGRAKRKIPKMNLSTWRVVKSYILDAVETQNREMRETKPVHLLHEAYGINMSSTLMCFTNLN